jgi:taurine dioxygenase
MWRVVGRHSACRRISATISAGSKTVKRCVSINVRPTSGSLGAVIENVDLRTLDNSTVESIRQALLDHLVIFFRKQDLDPAAFLAFTTHFGKPVPYPFVKGIDGYPEVIQVLKRENEIINFGGVWHADTTYLPEPPMGSVLLAREVPPYGGDTLFANQYAAYDTLSDGLKETLCSLRGISTSAKADASKTREDRIKDSGTATKEDHVVSHPAIRTHPETGRKALYVNVAHTERFEGWTSEESAPLLQYLFGHQIKPEFTCRFRWEKGSIAFWDNRCTQHNPVNDYHGFRRAMHRITLAGDKPI